MHAVKSSLFACALSDDLPVLVAYLVREENILILQLQSLSPSKSMAGGGSWGDLQL